MSSEKNSRSEKLGKLVSKQDLKKKLLELGIEHFTDKTIERVFNCANYLQIVFNYEKDSIGSSKIVKSNRCMNRFCPVCQATRSRKDAYMLDVILRYLREEFRYNFLFLTLTVPNVTSSELVGELNRQYESLQRLIKRKEFKKISLGYIRKTEITYNAERNDYHPHIHMLIAVKASYFKSRDYVKRDTWLKIWRECTGNSEITQVDIRKANEKSFRELAKYEAKAIDFLGYSQEVFDTFYFAMKGRKMFTWNGCFLEGKKKYKKGDLDKYKEIDENEYTHISFHSYNKTDYDLIKERKMNKKEFEKYNNMAIMEEEIVDE